MSRFLSLCSQRAASGVLTRCALRLETEGINHGADGVSEVQSSTDISWVYAIGFPRFHKEYSLSALLRICDRYKRDLGDKNAKIMNAKALGITAGMIGWIKNCNLPLLLQMINHPTKLSDAWYFLRNPAYDLPPEEHTRLFFQMLRRTGELGDTHSVLNLGICFQNGDGVRQDKAKAIRFYKLASNMGNSDAMNNLGICYKRGDGVAQNKRKALQWYQKAANLFNADAMVNLAWLYYEGDGIPQDLTKAVQLYQQAADLGHKTATYNLACCYRQGDGVAQDMTKAAQWFKRGSDLGDYDALCGLANCYKNGDGVPQDVTKAIRMFHYASGFGNRLANYHLALCYQDGDGVPQNLAVANELFRRVKQHDERNRLKHCHQNGNGAAQDKAKST